MNTSKVYQARRVPHAIKTLSDPALKDPLWEQANVETGFSFPWERRAVPRTEFRALYDEHALHFAFDVEDDDIVLAESFQSKEDVIHEDRVELFFSLDEGLTEYFCIEIDPLGRVLDYRAAHHRQLDFSWTFPGLQTAGVQTNQGYAVRGLIPWASLASLGFAPPESGRRFKFGIYRAEFGHAAGGTVSESWISWVDPQTAEPDFHVPQSFGYLQLSTVA